MWADFFALTYQKIENENETLQLHLMHCKSLDEQRKSKNLYE